MNVYIQIDNIPTNSPKVCTRLLSLNPQNAKTPRSVASLPRRSTPTWGRRIFVNVYFPIIFQIDNIPTDKPKLTSPRSAKTPWCVRRGISLSHTLRAWSPPSLAGQPPHIFCECVFSYQFLDTQYSNKFTKSMQQITYFESSKCKNLPGVWVGYPLPHPRRLSPQ